MAGAVERLFEIAREMGQLLDLAGAGPLELSADEMLAAGVPLSAVVSMEIEKGLPPFDPVPPAGALLAEAVGLRPFPGPEHAQWTQRIRDLAQRSEAGWKRQAWDIGVLYLALPAMDWKPPCYSEMPASYKATEDEAAHLAGCQHMSRVLAFPVIADRIKAEADRMAAEGGGDEAGAVELPEERRAVAKSASGAIVLYNLKDCPFVLGKRKSPLSTPRYAVVKALIEAGEQGLTKDGLVKASGKGGAVNIMKGLAGSDKDWEAVLLLPGKTGGRYRIK